MIDFDALKHQIRPLFPKEQTITSVEKEYFAFYGIDLEDSLDNVQHRFGSLDSCKYQIACHLFEQENAKGTFFVLHGYYDHVGLFGHIVSYLLKQGYNVLAYDLPGHGLSSGKPATIPDFSIYTQILTDILTACSGQLPRPCTVMGKVLAVRF